MRDYSKWGIYTFWWHSINLIPTLTITSTCHEDDFEKIISNHLQLTILGLVFNVIIPTDKYRCFIPNVYGPLWSRRRRKWYFDKKDLG